LQPNQKEHLYQLAESYFNTGDVDDAISYYKSTLEIDDRFAEAYNHIGYAYSWKGDHDSAIQALNRYLEINASANAFDSLGDAYMYAGSYDKAAKMKEQAFQKNLDMYYVKRGQALIEICQGKLDSAESRLHAFVGSALIKNEAARYQAALAYLYYRRGEWEKAFASCSLGVELLGTVGALPDSPAEELYWLHGMIELQRGHIPAAKGSLQMLTDVLNRNKISASNYKPWYKFARHLELRILTAERNIPAALQAAQDLDFIKGKLGYWGTIYERAFIFDEIGQSLAALALHAEAKKAFQDAIAYNPHYALAHYHYARLLLDQGAKTDAGEQFGAFLSEWKEADRNLPEVGLALKMAKELGIQPR
jgi:tetratricopeptide (TPR) repeat protein